MTSLHGDQVLRKSMESARYLQASGADVDQIMARLDEPQLLPRIASRLNAPAVWLATLAAVAGLMFVPAVRAGVADLADTFAGYFSGGDSTAVPGRAVTAADPPPKWLTSGGRTDQRLIAEAGEHRLFLVRQRGGEIGFAFGDAVGVSDSAEGWTRQFAESSAVVLGPGARVDPNGVMPLYGLTDGAVASVEVRHDQGPSSLAESGRGGFVALVEPGRTPIEVAALDADGNVLELLDLGHIPWGGFTGG